MDRKFKIWITSTIYASLVFLTFDFTFRENLHFVIVQFYYLLIVLLVTWYRKYLFLILLPLQILHLILDSISLSAFPRDALLETVAELFVAVVLLIVTKEKNDAVHKLQNFVNVTHTGTWEWNLKEGTTTYNEEWANILGYTLDELGPQKLDVWKQLTHPDDYERSFEAINRALDEKHDDYESQFRMKHKDGHWVWILDKGKVVKWDKNNQPEIMVGTHTDITNIKEMEDNINYQNQRFENIVLASPDSIFGIDLDYRYTFVYSNWDSITKLEDDHFVGHRIDEIYQDEDARKRIQACEQAKTNGEGSYEWSDLDPEGNPRYYHTIISPIFDAHDEIMSYVGVARNITQLISTELELKSTHDLLRYVVEYNPTSVAVFDKDMNYVYVSASYKKNFQIDVPSVIGMNHFEIFSSTSKERKAFYDRSLKGEVMTCESELYHQKDGKIDYIKWSTRPWFDGNGKIVGIIFYSEIITEKIRLEDEIRKQMDSLFIEKNRVESTLSSIGDAVISTNEKGMIVSINPIAQQLTGWKKEEAIGRSFLDVFNIINEETGTRSYCPVNEVLLKKQNIELPESTILISKQGQRYYIEDSASPIINQEGKLVGAVLVFRDVTKVQEEQKQIRYLGTHDFLTDLYNRRFFVDQLKKCDQEQSNKLAIAMIDLNGLKLFNDAFGHETGDKVLRIVADILKESCTMEDYVSRIGGDEFTIIITKATEQKITMIQDTIQKAINEVKIENIQVSIAIGIAKKMASDEDIDDVIKRAENEMYKNKIVEGMSIRNHAITAILETLTDKFEEERIHSQRVAALSVAIGKAMKLKDHDLKELEMAGMYHDIGKIAIPDAILRKPGKLTKDEFDVIKTHTEVGYQILRAADEYSRLADYALSHHERWDGLGYPRGLKGLETPLFSRIIAVADSYEAMTADRPYRKKMKHEDAVAEIARCSGTQFDPKIAELFLSKVSKQSEIL